MSQTHPTTLRTDRLHLVAATPELLRAHLESFAALSTVLDAEVDAMPSDLEDSNLQWSLEAFERNPAAAGWLMWYFVLQLEDGGRRLVGVGGYKGPPSEGGTVEVGYAVVEDEQGNGYATEATTELVRHAFDDDRVRAVIAETYPALVLSIGVLEKCGFACVGKGSSDGSLRYAFLRGWLE